jgi:hypothetical protein
MNYTYLHFDVAEWLVNLTSGAPTDVIHRVPLAVHLNSFYPFALREPLRKHNCFCEQKELVLEASPPGGAISFTAAATRRSISVVTFSSCSLSLFSNSYRRSSSSRSLLLLRLR